MLETLYKTETPVNGRSECYVLVLASRPASEGRAYVFMKEHGCWDENSGRFIHEVETINTEGRLTRDEGLAMFNSAKQNLAERGFVHVIVPEYSRKMTKICQLRELETVVA
jgi:hypothetical protein